MAVNNKGSGIVVLIGLSLGIGGIYAIDWSFLKGQITDYTISCGLENIDWDNQRCVHPLVREGLDMVYTVNTETQTVLAQFMGTSPFRLVDCVVVDRKNWWCKMADVPGALVVSVGQGDFNDGEPEGPYLKHVSRIEWLLTPKRKKS